MGTGIVSDADNNMGTGIVSDGVGSIRILSKEERNSLMMYTPKFEWNECGVIVQYYLSQKKACTL